MLMEYSYKKGHRLLGVELARIIACICVICVHIGLITRNDTGYIKSRLLLSCFIADGVAIFWLIMGFFLFQNDNYLKIIKRTIRKVFVPMIVCYLISFYFIDAIIGNISFGENISKPLSAYIYQLKQFLILEPSFPYCGHYWYLYIYFMVILCFPILKSFIKYLDSSNKRISIFIIIVFTILIWNDSTSNILLGFSHHTLNALIPAMIIICIGYYLYKFKDKLLVKYGGLTCSIIFLLVNILRMNIIYNCDGHEYTYYNLLYWYSACGVICAICIIIVCMKIMHKISEKSILGLIVRAIGENTFGIYLIHFFVMDFIKSKGIYAYILNITTTIPVRWLADIIYLAITTLFILGLSWVIIYICKNIFYKIILLKYK